MKKLGLMLGTLVTIATPVVAVVSCGDNKTNENKINNNVETIKATTSGASGLTYDSYSGKVEDEYSPIKKHLGTDGQTPVKPQTVPTAQNNAPRPGSANVAPPLPRIKTQEEKLNEWKIVQEEKSPFDNESTVKQFIKNLYDFNVKQSLNFNAETNSLIINMRAAKVVKAMQAIDREFTRAGSLISPIAKNMARIDWTYANSLGDTPWKQVKCRAMIVDKVYKIYESLLNGKPNSLYISIDRNAL